MKIHLSIGKKYNREEINAHALCILVSADLIEELIRVVLYPSHWGNSVIISVINVAFYFLAFFLILLFSSLTIRKGSIISAGLFLLGMSMAVLSTFFVNQRISVIAGSMLQGAIIASLFFLIGLAPINLEVFYNDMLKMSFFAIIYGYMALIKYVLDEVYLNIGYNILPFLLVSYILFKTTKSPCSIISFLLLGLLLVISGGRMPLVVFIAFWLGYNILKKSDIRKSVSEVLLIIFFGMGGLIVLYLAGFVKSRSLQMVLNGSFFSMSGREVIYKLLLDEVKQSCFAIRGLYGDRFGLYDMWLQGVMLNINPKNPYTAYAHNLFVEVLYDYGILIGGIICLIILSLLFRMIRGIYYNKNNMTRAYFLLWCTVGVLPLMVSGSFLIKNVFWLTLAIATKKNSNLYLKEQLN